MTRILLLVSIILASCAALAQQEQEYVPRYTAFAGYAYVNTPKIALVQRGFDLSFGVNVRRWLTLGADYSWFDGRSDLFPRDLTAAIQRQLVGVIPPGTIVFLPFDSVSYTYTAGPQFNYRGMKRATFFARPAVGGFHETATLHPNTPLTRLLVAQLVPSGKKSDLVLFYGFGGGFEVVPTKRFGIQFAADYVHVNLFEGFLASGRNALRLTVGPTFRFGRNVK